MVPHDGDMSGYNANVDAIREKEYPMLKGERVALLTDVS